MSTDQPKEKVFTSPTKVENDDEDFFNISWWDHSYTTETDLDTILTTPSEGIDCDIKEIINNICGNVETSPKNSISPSKQRNEQLPTPTAPKLSKCIKYFQHLSPAKQSFFNKMEKTSLKFDVKATTPQSMQISGDFGAKESTSKFKVPEMLKSGTTSFVKNPKVLKKNREIPLATSIDVDQCQLANRDRLNVVSKTDPQTIHCEIAQIKEKLENNASNSSEKSFDSSNQLPILIEIIGTSASYHLDVNQFSNGSEPCSSHQLDHNNLHTTQNKHNTTMNTTLQERITSQTTDFISSEEKISTDTKSINISLERSEFDFQIVKAATVKDQQKEPTQINENLIPLSVLEKKMKRKKIEERKEQERLQKLAEQDIRKQKRKLKRRQLEKKLLLKKQKKTVNVNTNSNNSDIKHKEVFHGFETLEPFHPIQLQTKPLIWL